MQSGRSRVIVEGAAPQVDGGRYPAKRVVGEPIDCACDLVSDGHDAVAGRLLYRRAGTKEWAEAPLAPRGNDRFGASFLATSTGRWEFTFEAWIDHFTTWARGLAKKAAAQQDVTLDLLTGAKMVAAATARAKSLVENEALSRAAALLGDPAMDLHARVAQATSPELARVMADNPDRSHASRLDEPLALTIDPKLARFGAWYEFFPRSSVGRASLEPLRHRTLREAEERLPYVADMGFDVLYLPPIHPIGRAYRKGPNNTLTAGPDDVGSPWAIGAAEGGHKAVHPELGTLDDLRRFVARARSLGIEVALDVAFQVSPDHPYVKEHPEWFLKRPDGSIQYAENPPKKYQDVYPFDFECDAWESLWTELTSVVTFWAEQGVRVFRVDNPHTKSLRFWERCIAEVKAQYPDTVFLAEAFTRPKLMYALAKMGFSQSYTYFTWRHTKEEFTEYLRELTRPPVSDFFRPNFWPNTPDILPEHLQYGGRPVFVQRLILAAMMSASYGIYGPPFELMEHVARPGAEEYIDNEKFQLRSWDVERPDSLAGLIGKVNRIRRENPALHDNRISFHHTDNPHLLCFGKRDASGENVVLCVVNLDTNHTHAGWVELDLPALGVQPHERYQVHDLLADARYQWSGTRNYVELDPRVTPAHVFRIRKHVRTEHDFEYFL
ncbi:MAG: alpha-1,4-glucan--maltose-1-phosphate maltosyltransferase [Labilithrix sp.]|nr:alpha-1,4-glucan--maltose-1-phosphate maltosyltransferase [Labilithrix sp.]MCW5811861.1 alpha-1,4-glucan--maltose-1-phosphate maltosyltransferase [Labilithrix sp.]